MRKVPLTLPRSVIACPAKPLDIAARYLCLEDFDGSIDAQVDVLPQIDFGEGSFP